MFADGALLPMGHGVWPHCLFHHCGGMGVWMLQVAACQHVGRQPVVFTATSISHKTMLQFRWW